MKKNILRAIVGILLIVWAIAGEVRIGFWKIIAPTASRSFSLQLNNIHDISWSFFRSPGESLEQELTAFNTTKRNLDIWTYEFTQKDIKTALKRLAQSGVNIRIIVEDKKFQQYQNTLKELSGYFSGYTTIQLKSDKQMGTEYTHAKVNLIDNGFIIQTANLTHSSFAKNREHFFQSTDSWVRKSLHTIFEKDRKGELLTMKDINANLVVCNINCRGVIETLLRWAKSSIIIQTQYITDDRIREILKTKRDVQEFKVLVADTHDNDDLVAFFGDEYAKKFKHYYNHTKMILIDHKILLLWSMNLSATSLDKNREIGILLIDQSLIDKFAKQFYDDWKHW